MNETASTPRPNHRDLTRKERYELKSVKAKKLPIIPICVNFMFEENVAFVARAASCFGANSIGVIGTVPERPELKARSGGLSDRIHIHQFANPSGFLDCVRKTGGLIVAAELTDTAESAFDFQFPQDKLIWLVLGHEETGVPAEILLAADAVIQIPMLGVGYSLNCSQTCNVLLFEYCRQLSAKGRV